MQEQSLAPLNSMVILSDVAGGEVPGSFEGRAIAHTETCIAIGCKAEVDGETVFVLSDTGDMNPAAPAHFTSGLLAPSRKIALRTVDGKTVFEHSTAGETVTVSIWLSDPFEPDRVVIGIDDSSNSR